MKVTQGMHTGGSINSIFELVKANAWNIVAVRRKEFIKTLEEKRKELLKAGAGIPKGWYSSQVIEFDKANVIPSDEELMQEVAHLEASALQRTAMQANGLQGY